MTSKTLQFQSTTGEPVATLQVAPNETVRDVKIRLLAGQCAAAASLDFTGVGSNDEHACFFDDRTVAVKLPLSLVVWQWIGGDGSPMRVASMLKAKLDHELQFPMGWEGGASQQLSDLDTSHSSPPMGSSLQQTAAPASGQGHRDSGLIGPTSVGRTVARQPGEQAPFKDFDDVVDNVSDAATGQHLLRGIYSYGFEKPSEIQAWAMPQILRRKSVVATAASGTGKTAAFLIGVIGRVSPREKVCQAVIFAPSREVVNQIFKIALALGAYIKGLRCTCLIGGTSVRDSIDHLREGPQIVCGSPGRVQDMASKRHLKTESVKVLVVDDADAMLQDEAVGTFHRALPRSVQVCLFSATMPADAIRKAERFAPNALYHLVPPSETVLETTKHFYIAVEKEEWKLDTVCDLFEILAQTQVLLFFSTNRKIDFFADQLAKRDFSISAMHTDFDQKERDLVMREFRSGCSRVLLTGSLMARGIDVQQVSLVVNVDMPSNPVDYVHRAGRCSRFGRKGVVLTLLLPSEKQWMDAVRNTYHVEVEECPMDISDLI